MSRTWLQKKSLCFSLLSHTHIVLTVVSSYFHTIFCSSLYSHCSNTFFLFFTSQHESKPHNFFFICALYKSFVEKTQTLLFLILGILPKQKSHFSLLVSCPILLFFFSSDTIKFFATLSIYKTSNQIP